MDLAVSNLKAAVDAKRAAHSTVPFQVTGLKSPNNYNKAKVIPPVNLNIENIAHMNTLKSFGL